jgi:toluene monooxygenase electron transfer component
MNDFTVQIHGGEDDVSFRLREGHRSLLRSALHAGIGFPYECHSGGCGSCRFELLEGEVDVLWPQAPGLTDRDRRRNRYLACQCVARSDIRIKVSAAAPYRPKVPPRVFRARFVEALPVTHDIVEFRFVGEGPAEFLPGQYALMQLPGVEGARAYSMSNTPNSRGEWHFQIRRVSSGKGSAYLMEHLRPGDSLEVDGPYGLAFLRTESPRDIVCVAGGSGLAPVVSIARGAAEAGMLDSRQLHFFYGGRAPRDICGDDFLRGLPGYGERIRYYPIVSLLEDGPDSVWKGEIGFVHELVRRTLAGRLKDLEFYFAGPPPMSQALQEMLMVEYQVPFEQIHFDRFF